VPSLVANTGMKLAAIIQFAFTELTLCFNPLSEIVIFFAGLPLFRPNEPIRRTPMSISVALTRHFSHVVIHFGISNTFSAVALRGFTSAI
jgi:hypothetical protein